MGQPVKLSDALVLDARLAAKATGRSIASQVELWARLGRAIEPLLQGAHVLALGREVTTRPVWQCLQEVDSPTGMRRLADHLRQGPYPHYEAHSDRKGLLVRIEADGTLTIGRFVGRRFSRGGAPPPLCTLGW